jgi:sigma-B regulation protein RsbU (phosphoserine phosphatase)
MYNIPMKHKIKLPILALELIIATLLFGTLMTIVNSLSGYREFKKELENLYGDITIQLAKTGASYIHVDSIPYWVKNEPDEEWEDTNKKLDTLTNTSDLAYIYVSVISPDYKQRTYVFDTVNKLSLEAGSKVIPFGTVSSLENKDEEYINNLKLVIEEGKNYTSFTYKDEGGHVTTAIPLFGTDGKVTAIMSIVKPMNEIKEHRKNFLRSIIISATILTLLFIALYALLLYFGIIRPIVFITHETSHFAEHHGELTGILKKIRNRDEIGKLAKAVEKMSRDMNKYIEDLTHATAEKERLGAELNVARQIQAEMLPRVFPPYKNHPELELYASMTPAKEVGGDFYDFYLLDDDHFAMVVGDVSGKGVPAALFMVITKTLLKDTAEHEYNPAKIFEHVNKILCEGNESGLFVTCWMGILTLSTGELNFANAGHNAPIIKNGGEIKYLSTKPNLMLAAMDGIPYTNNTLKLTKGDRLFIYSDGITEATNDYNELYGEERLLSVLKSVQNNGISSRDLLDIVRNDLNDFVLDAPQFDDITMLAMTYKE